MVRMLHLGPLDILRKNQPVMMTATLITLLSILCFLGFGRCAVPRSCQCHRRATAWARSIQRCPLGTARSTCMLRRSTPSCTCDRLVRPCRGKIDLGRSIWYCAHQLRLAQKCACSPRKSRRAQATHELTLKPALQVHVLQSVCRA